MFVEQTVKRNRKLVETAVCTSSERSDHARFLFD